MYAGDLQLCPGLQMRPLPGKGANFCNHLGHFVGTSEQPPRLLRFAYAVRMRRSATEGQIGVEETTVKLKNDKLDKPRHIAKPSRLGGQKAPKMAPVFLNVYDLTGGNAYTYWCGVGIFHAGRYRHSALAVGNSWAMGSCS